MLSAQTSEYLSVLFDLNFPDICKEKAYHLLQMYVFHLNYNSGLNMPFNQLHLKLFVQTGNGVIIKLLSST